MDRLKNIFIYIMFTIVVLLVTSLVIIEIKVWVNYGGKPINEIPAWALWFMFNND